MLFFVRSAFWLGMVYSAMPFDSPVQSPRLASLRSALAASTGRAIVAACPDQSLACRALDLAMPRDKLAPAILAAVNDKGPRESANSLTKDDLAPQWRGKRWKAPNGPALAQRASMPI
jgi:hypothetical protein